jgi:hypothetical protein
MDAVAGALRDALCGPRGRDRPEVVWTDGGAEILLHVGKLQARTVVSTLVVAVDTESTEYGVAPLVVRFTFGEDEGPASLVAATDAQALGHPAVAARWGDLFRDVVWAALARLVEVAGDGMPLMAIRVAEDRLTLSFGEPFSFVDLAHTHVQDRIERGLRPALAVELQRRTDADVR